MHHLAITVSAATALTLAWTAGALVAPPARPKSPAPPAATAPTSSAPKSQPTTIVPVPREDQWWQERHAAAVKRAQQGDVDLLFIGDSITQGWEGEGRDAWNAYYAPRKAENLGFSGDRTQHVLWRLQNGEVDYGDGHAPKLAIIMIGTNNSNGEDNTAEEIAMGIEAIVATLREKLPATKILLLAIFPRGDLPLAESPQRQKNLKAGKLASRVADGAMVHYLDIGSRLTNPDGTVSLAIMPDYLHLSTKGYKLWADAMESQVKALMGDAPAANP